MGMGWVAAICGFQSIRAKIPSPYYYYYIQLPQVFIFTWRIISLSGEELEVFEPLNDKIPLGGLTKTMVKNHV